MAHSDRFERMATLNRLNEEYMKSWAKQQARFSWLGSFGMHCFRFENGSPAAIVGGDSRLEALQIQQEKLYSRLRDGGVDELLARGNNAKDWFHRLQSLLFGESSKQDVAEPTPSTTQGREPLTRAAFVDPQLWMLVLGANDEHSVLYPLRRMPQILRHVMRFVRLFWLGEWEPKIRIGVSNPDSGLQGCKIYGSIVATGLRFPPPQGIKINMMPIIMGVGASIPAEYRHYLPLLLACPIARSEVGQVGYLTIDEQVVQNGRSHRRGGLHTEGGYELESDPKGVLPEAIQPRLRSPSSSQWKPQTDVPMTVAWGRGVMSGDHQYAELKGGIFMASNVAHSCRVWNAEVDPAYIGQLGSLEHMRPLLGPGADIDAGDLLWVTDLTPHESLPLPEGTCRQYFRLVTSDVSAWYSKHSTHNPLGIRPPESVHIIRHDKFETTVQHQEK